MSECMPTRAPLWGLAATLAFGLAASLLPVDAAQETQPEKAKEPDSKAELAEFLGDAKHYAIRVVKPETELKLREPAVLNFTNPERNQELGSVFVWLDPDGRPAVMGQFFRYNAPRGRVKKHALHSLVQGELEAKFNDKLAWAPVGPGVEWKSFPDSPAVAPAQKQRLAQMKQLAQRISVQLTDPRAPDKPIGLRRLDRPLFDYAAPKQGVTDGAIFSYVVATDPEAILLVEAFDEKGKKGFRYALARFHFWKLTALLGDKTVWDVGYDPAMMRNALGDRESIKKVYNSFVP